MVYVEQRFQAAVSVMRWAKNHCCAIGSLKKRIGGWTLLRVLALR